MAITVKHSKTSLIADAGDATLVQPSDWNSDHTLTGLGTMAEQNANAVAITGGTMSGVTVTGYIPTTQKAAALGVATLDAGGTVPLSQIPASIQGGVSYQGTWNASTNTPTLSNGVGTKGYYYVVSVAGSTNLDGITAWNVGDWAIFNGTVWQKVDNTDAVTSVNGYTGTVVLTNTDISGFGTMSTQNANSVAITGGAIDGTTIGATTTSTGKFTTLNASTSLTTPIVQASNSGGLSLKNSAGTTQISMGAGGGDNASINVSTNINGTNAQIDISPTGTGHVHINPTGVNSIQINPTYVGTMDNMTIGATTPKAITGTTITATSFVGSGASLTSIPNSALTNSAITINGTSTSLGGSISVGTVTSVTGTSPVVSSGGNTPAISMPAATSSVNGYLTSADWTTFNNKGSGTVTSVTGTAPVVSSGGATPAISMAAATGSVNGYLTSTDWTTFNGKANAFTYTSNYVPYGQGTTTPAQSSALQFNGTTLTTTNDASISGLTVGKGTGSLRNTVVGQGALNANTTGFGGTYIGYQTGITNTTGTSNTFIGEQSGYFNTTGSYNTGLGQSSYASNSTTATGSYNTSLGALALYNNTSASGNTAVGYQAGYSNTTSTFLTALGYQAGYTSNANENTFIGYQAGKFTTGAGVTAIGNAAAQANTTGGNNIAIGSNSLVSNTTGSNNVAIGSGNAGVAVGALGNNTTASNNTAVGYQAGYSTTTAGGNTFIGRLSGYSTTGIDNTFIGITAGYSMTTGTKNTILGGFQGNQGGLDIRTSSNYIVLSDGDGNPRVQVDGSGNFFIGATATSGFSTSTGGFQVAGGGNGAIITGNSGTGLSNRMYFVNGTAGSLVTVGTISTSGSLTSYNVSSDRRLKENIIPLTTGLSTILALKPSEYNYIADSTTKIQGFIADELQDIVPHAVSGEKNAVDEKGKPVYQGVDASFLIPFLVASIQELKAEFDAYKATHS